MSDPNTYTVGWICAIMVEYVAAQLFLDEEHEGPQHLPQNDYNDYKLGKMGSHNVVIAVLPDGEYGTSSAARVAADMHHSFPNVRIGLMVGIGGGAPTQKNGIRLGDVVVSSPANGIGGILQYDSGKAIQDQTFQISKFLNQPPTYLRTAVQGLRSHYEIHGNQLEVAINFILEKKPRLRKYRRPAPNSDILYCSDFLHVSDNMSKCSEMCGNDPSNIVCRPVRSEDEDNPMIHYGIIASANTLMKDATIRDQLAAEKGVLCFEMESAGLINHFPCLVIRGICDYADTHKNDEWHGYAAMTAAAYAKDLLCRIAPSKVEAKRRIDSQLEKIDEKLDAINQRSIIDQLPIAREATFNSNYEVQNSTCFEGTRVDILHQISQWTADVNANSIFWLSGMAGTGKSTISRTVAKSFAGRLGASFFFKRGAADRGSASKLFTTIAADLIVREPAIAPYIKRAIDADPAIPWKGLQEQFDLLISQPLLEFVKVSGKLDPIIIVIDALDECEQDSQIKLIIDILSSPGVQETLCLRTFVTSRPDLPVRLGFHVVKHQTLILHEISETVIKHDISLFLQHKMAEIRVEFNASVSKDRQLPTTWPGDSNFQSLVKMAVPLFIFAATISLFIADRRGGDPDEKLKDVLLYESRSQESKLDATYMPVLNSIISGLSTREREKVTQQFQSIIGPVIILAGPLSPIALSRILDISKRTIDNQLDLLHSVLHVPSSPESPIKLLHISFRDFLTDPDKKGNSVFWVDEKRTHANMALNCLRLMERHLKSYLCGIREPGILRSDFQPSLIEASLPSDVQYACLYWVYHFKQAKTDINIDEMIYGFLTRHFLHWIEALSLMGRARESLGLIKRLFPARYSIRDLELVCFLDDAVRFIRQHITAIEATPLQIYSSLLIFSPRDSIVKRTFQNQVSWIVREPEIEKEIWNQHLQTLEGHRGAIEAVAFSHDSLLLASASEDRTVRVWQTETGECIQELQIDDTAIESITFLEDSKYIASVSKKMTICIHEVDTGKCILQLKGYHKIHGSAIAAYNSALFVAAASKDMVRIWDINARKCLEVLHPHSEDVVSLAISNDLNLVASISNDKTIFIWDLNLKKPLRRIQAIGAIAFSCDSKLIVAGGIDHSVQVWPVVTGNTLHTFRGHSGPITAVVFSEDSKLVASASVDRTVKIWHIEQGVCLQEMHTYSRWVHSIAFSHDSALIALASDDAAVRIWYIDGTEKIEEVNDQPGPVMSIVASPDSTLVASLHYADQSMRMWSVEDGEYVGELVSHDWVRSAMFSPNSALIATCAVDQTANIWSTDTGDCVYALLVCSAWLESLTFSHDSALAASASTNGLLVHIWDIKERKEVLTLHGHSGMIRSIEFSHNSPLLLTASEDKTARIWSIESGVCLQELQGHTGEVTFACFSYDSALVISASSDKLQVWDVQSGSCIQACEGRTAEPKLAAFSPDSTLVAASYSDNIVKLWNVIAGDSLWEIDLGATTTRLTFLPTASCLVTDLGAIDLQHLATTKEGYCPVMYRYGISRDRSWITWNGQNILWLPPEYRPSCSVVLGTTVMLGSYSGSVISFEFSDEPEF